MLKTANKNGLVASNRVGDEAKTGRQKSENKESRWELKLQRIWKENNSTWPPIAKEVKCFSVNHKASHKTDGGYRVGFRRGCCKNAKTTVQ
ncbi:hypothetical protein CEXT_571611 [Caerostris extrusa]|uniref:Uncharacterized protein n=1 Tax=Caerostris extrusa TaxID=172846 RepID=A0AAV4WFT5_CAEEX|nr:hypothetical protein CEXT_571611 [Caerostris extrusa]